jgi:hypothetical protein
MDSQKRKLALAALLISMAAPAMPEAQAGIHGTLTVRNSRDAQIVVGVETSDGSIDYYYVDAHSYENISVNDTSEGVTQLYAYEGGVFVDGESASGSYNSYTWWVD